MVVVADQRTEGRTCQNGFRGKHRIALGSHSEVATNQQRFLGSGDRCWTQSKEASATDSTIQMPEKRQHHAALYLYTEPEHHGWNGCCRYDVVVVSRPILLPGCHCIALASGFPAHSLTVKRMLPTDWRSCDCAYLGECCNKSIRDQILDPKIQTPTGIDSQT